MRGTYTWVTKKGYVCSFSSKNLVSATLTLSPHKGGAKKIIRLVDRCMFSIPFYSYLGTVIVEGNSNIDNKIGIQIEEGRTPTKYESPRYSETQICIRGSYNKEYNPKNASHINFSRRIVLINGKEEAINYEDVERYNRIVCYPGGFLTYHHGETEIGPKRTIGPRSAVTFVDEIPLNPD